jgi:Tol biopolymer transport system component
LPIDQKATEYVVWTPAGLSATRSGDPVAVSADGRLLAVDHYPPLDPTQPQQSRLDIVRTDDGSVVASYPKSYGVFGFSPDGSKVAFGPGYTGGDTRFFIMDVASGRVSVADSCATQHGKWLDNSHVIVHSVTSCSQAAGSDVTIETTPDPSIAVSAEGAVASVGGIGVPAGAVVNIRLTIQKRAGERETIDYQGWDQNLWLDWSPDGSLLLLQYWGPGSSNPPTYVVLLRP